MYVCGKTLNSFYRNLNICYMKYLRVIESYEKGLNQEEDPLFSCTIRYCLINIWNWTEIMFYYY